MADIRKWSRRAGAGLIVLLIALQFVPVTRDNPPTIQSRTIYSIEDVPANVRSVFERSCHDCHSNDTRWIWYSYVAPVSWMVAHDVHEARRKLNFSEWGGYSAKKKDHELEEICNELLDGEMPDSKYVLIHRQARVTQDERETVCKWTNGPQH
jgi:hypothetical protein